MMVLLAMLEWCIGGPESRLPRFSSVDVNGHWDCHHIEGEEYHVSA